MTRRHERYSQISMPANDLPYHQYFLVEAKQTGPECMDDDDDFTSPGTTNRHPISEAATDRLSTVVVFIPLLSRKVFQNPSMQGRPGPQRSTRVSVKHRIVSWMDVDGYRISPFFVASRDNENGCRSFGEMLDVSLGFCRGRWRH